MMFNWIIASCLPPSLTLHPATFAALPLDDRTVGRWLFAAVFALLIVWLVAMPARRLWRDAPAPPWWRNVRVWAIVVAAVQMVVYLAWG